MNVNICKIVMLLHEGNLVKVKQITSIETSILIDNLQSVMLINHVPKWHT